MGRLRVSLAIWDSSPREHWTRFRQLPFSEAELDPPLFHQTNVPKTIQYE